MADVFSGSNIAADQYKKELEQETQKKTTIDHKELQTNIEQITSKASKSNLDKSLEKLLVLEKKCRQEEDSIATKSVCLAIIGLVRQYGDWEKLNQYIVLLAKRRSQLKQAIQGYVQLAMTYLNQVPDKKVEIELIKTLLDVTEGKLFVELERSRLTYRLVKIRENEGNIEEAADLIQDLAVETYGTMHKNEKIAFILEQVRLVLQKGDLLRAQMLSRKVTARSFQEDKKAKDEGMEVDAKQQEENPLLRDDIVTLKIKYYQLLIQYYQFYGDYLEIARCYRAIYDTPEVQQDKKEASGILERIIWYVLLSPAYSTDEHSQSDYETLLLGLARIEQVKDMPLHEQILKWFINQEIIHVETLEDYYRQHPEIPKSPVYLEVFNYKYDPPKQSSDLSSKGERKVMQDEIAGNKDRYEQFQIRVHQHNIMVMAKYYQRTTLDRLALMLHLQKDKAENLLCDLVVAKAVYAKIDRATGVVKIGKPAATEQVLNLWSKNITKLVTQVEKSSQAIQKEFIIHKIAT